MNRNVERLRQPGRQRAVLYLRQSTFREESISLEVQEKAARDHAERQGYEVVGVESDPGVTGRTWQRQGVQRAMRALEERRAEVIVLWRWSRLSRSRKDWALAADRADLAGGRIESATEPNDATAAGRFGRGIMVELAAFESERIGEQWREAHQHRVAQGLPATGGPRFGYEVVDGRYVPDAETGPILADLYRRYLAGMGSAQLTRWLNDVGMRGRSRPWTYQTTMNVLDSGFGAGLLGQVRPVKLPCWEREYRPGVHPPVIDRGTWDAYVARRRERHRMPVRRSPYLLSGLLRCGDCSGPMHGKMDRREAYHCSRASMTTGARKVSIVAWRIEAEVEAWVFGLASKVEAQADAAEGTRTKRQRADFTARSAQRRIDKAADRLAALTMKLADGTVSDEAYRLAAAAIEADRAEAKLQLQSAAPNPVEEAAPAALPNDLVRLWPRMTVQQRNMVLRPLISHIEVQPATHRGSIAPRVKIVPRWEA